MYSDHLDSENFAPKKSLGQNFLTSPVVPTWMCEAGQVTADDQILEIGPGTGALTKVLLERGAIVHAVETDKRAVAILEQTFASEIAEHRLFLYQGDVRDMSLLPIAEKQSNYKIIANIPYYLSGFLLRTCLELEIPPNTLVFLMQKEVVNRIARDQKQSLLSLSVAVYGQPHYYKTVSRGHFHPAPAVDSAILLVQNISHQNLPTEADRQSFFALLHQGLGQKRKQLLSNLAHVYSRDQLTKIFIDLKISLTVRGEDLPLATWLQLQSHLKTISA